MIKDNFLNYGLYLGIFFLIGSIMLFIKNLISIAWLTLTIGLIISIVMIIAKWTIYKKERKLLKDKEIDDTKEIKIVEKDEAEEKYICKECRRDLGNNQESCDGYCSECYNKEEVENDILPYPKG